MMVLENNTLLAGLKKSMVEEKENKNDKSKDNITRIEINIETEDYKDRNIIRNYNKLNNIKTNEIIHSNSIDKEIAIRSTINDKWKDIKRGEVFRVSLEKGVGSEQSGDRYCICIQNDVGNKFSPTIIVAFATSQVKAKLPTHVEFTEGMYGFKKDSVIMLEQLRTLDKKRIIERVGCLDELGKRKINKALQISVFDLEEKNTLEKLPKEGRNYIINKLKFIETCKQSIQFYKSINGDKHSIALAEDEKFKEENALKYYCYNNKINYNEIYNNYLELDKRRGEDVAL